MNRCMLLLLLVLFSVAASASDTIRFGSRIISVGDTESLVLRVAGKPDLRDPIENRYGALRGYRLEYDLQTKTVIIKIIQGRVRTIREIYD